MNTTTKRERWAYRAILVMMVPFLLPCVLVAGAWMAAEDFGHGFAEAWRR